MPFSASAVFLFHLFHIDRTFPFEDFFIQGSKQSHLARDWVNREGGDLAVFGLKLLNSQRGVGRCDRQSPFMKWANALEESSKRIH